MEEVDEDHRLDIRAFCLYPGESYLKFHGPELILWGEDAYLMLPIEWEECLTGYRPWFTCPECRRRCRYLYNRRFEEWTCRKCLGLVYRIKHVSPHTRLKKRYEALDRERRKGEHHRCFQKAQAERQAIQEVLEAAEYGKLARKKGTVLRIATRRVIEGMKRGDVPDVMCSAYLEGKAQEIRQWNRLLALYRKIRQQSKHS